MNTVMKEGFFVIEGIDGVFSGFSNGRTWNGYECPFFNEKECERVISAFNKANENYYLEAERTSNGELVSVGLFCIEDSSENDVYHPLLAGSERVFPIGSGFFIWEKIPNPVYLETIEDWEDAKVFFQALVDSNSVFHLEEDPREIYKIDSGERLFTESEADAIRQRQDEIFSLDWSLTPFTCPFDLLKAITEPQGPIEKPKLKVERVDGPVSYCWEYGSHSGRITFEDRRTIIEWDGEAPDNWEDIEEILEGGDFI